VRNELEESDGSEKLIGFYEEKDLVDSGLEYYLPSGLGRSIAVVIMLTFVF
jgi:hypothetical protein